MTSSFAKGLRNQCAPVAPSLTCLAMLFATSANAIDVVPHSQLTPYQVVEEGGNCLQVHPITFNVSLAACNASSDYQKFYLLNTKDGDIAPLTQTAIPGVEARIAYAPTFDSLGALVGQYNLLAYLNGSIVVDPLSTPTADSAHRWAISRAPSDTSGMAKVADGQAAFEATGTRLYKYGANGHWIEKTINGKGLPYGRALCTNEFFGGDPVVGVPKSCYVQKPFPAFTKYQVEIANFESGQCLYPSSSGTLTFANCYTGNVGSRTFTLLPTSYPQSQ